ncbi:triosephosphate isomerase [Desulfocapsa sulfexigens DSM 10523]|uniref:Triosephosphate isomerase n=1 Tax=Desulfocapsa sulfexigens (strain DSM 10523 / SB164P1) TaxID=1167006 RepID=M1P1H7_DESSD|nr:triose-phosphate isomerase [Desulfocapsa sulfexigens]AGF77363.1 triosephosphate isomerase [Desulfocapsa sulfexigens DSM 10523]
MKRRPLLAGNWKMHTTVIDACQLAAAIGKCSAGLADRDVLLAPPYTVLSEVAHVLQGSDVLIASQNVCWEAEGAFTGEISPTMIKSAGGTAAIIGHSERRQIFHEDHAIINKRVLGALAFGLIPVFCVGETLEEREGEKTFEILEEQLREGLAGVSLQDMGKTVVAYEPVWAIGTGKTASKEQAQEAHAFIRKLLAEMFEKNIADTVRILYGGSVKPDNVDELMAQTDIDGALVGGAALDADSFCRIINFI